MSSLKYVIAIVFVTMISVKPAHAYIDAGTGSLIAQALLGGVVGLSAFMKIYWLQIKHFFSNLFSRKVSPEE